MNLSISADHRVVDYDIGGRLLQILKEFSTDPILSDYAIDTVWEDMKAMKDCKYIISMLLDDNPRSGLTEKDPSF